MKVLDVLAMNAAACLVEHGPEMRRAMLARLAANAMRMTTHLDRTGAVAKVRTGSVRHRERSGE